MLLSRAYLRRGSAWPPVRLWLDASFVWLPLATLSALWPAITRATGALDRECPKT